MKHILFAFALLLLLASCSKEEAAQPEPAFFFAKLYWGTDSLVSYGRTDKEGPMLDFTQGYWGTDTGVAVLLYTAFVSETNSGPGNSYFSALKNGQDSIGSFRSPLAWAIIAPQQKVIFSEPGTEFIFIDRLANHPQWGRYAEGRVRFTGYFSTNLSATFNFTGNFRVKIY